MKVEIRADGSAVIAGYVNVPGKWSKPISERGRMFVETIAEGAFDRAIKRAKEIGESIFCLVDHDGKRAVGQTADGSLKLKEDNVGLFAEVRVTDAETVKRAEAGEVKGWSFGFRAAREEFSDKDSTLEKRTVTDLSLDEVSLILDMSPCYKATSIEVRADGTESVLERRFSEDGTAEVVKEAEEGEASRKGDGVSVRKYRTRLLKVKSL